MKDDSACPIILMDMPSEDEQYYDLEVKIYLRDSIGFFFFFVLIVC